MRWILLLFILILPQANAFNISGFFNDIENTITGWQIMGIEVPVEEAEETEEELTYFCGTLNECQEEVRSYIVQKRGEYDRRYIVNYMLERDSHLTRELVEGFVDNIDKSIRERFSEKTINLQDEFINDNNIEKSKEEIEKYVNLRTLDENRQKLKQNEKFILVIEENVDDLIKLKNSLEDINNDLKDFIEIKNIDANKYHLDENQEELDKIEADLKGLKSVEKTELEKLKSIQEDLTTYVDRIELEIIRNEVKELYLNLLESNILEETITGIPEDNIIKSAFTVGRDVNGDVLILLYPSCGDGTPYEECSINTPYYCNQGILEENCAICGAKPGTICTEVTVIPLNQTNTSSIVTREMMRVETCKDAEGICEFTCSADFVEVSRISDTCESKDDFPLLTGNIILTKDIEPKLRCCVPIETKDRYETSVLENLSTNLTHTDTKLILNLCENKLEFDKCTTQKPLYCTKGGLVSYCSQCGCPSDQICDFLTNTCTKPVKGVYLNIFKSFVTLTKTEELFIDKFISEDLMKRLSTPMEENLLLAPVKVEVQRSPIPGEDRILVDIDKNLMSLRIDKEGKPHIDFNLEN